MTLLENSISQSILAAAISTALMLVPLDAMSDAKDAASITEAFKQGEAHISFRLRYEDVDQDGAESATANTLKTQITYSSGTYNGFGLTVEMDDTTELGDTDYSDGVTNRGTAAIADPEVTEVNQAYLSYTTGSTTAKWGRQRMLLDNQRFVGGVGWRQDEQTYSGFTVASTPAAGLSLFYGYITSVNRIFAEVGDHNHDTHLLNVKYDTKLGSIIGYGYLIDNQTAFALSSNTYGLRWQGKAGAFVSYNLEYATQSDATDNPTEYTADYMLAELKGTVPVGATKLNLKVGYEVLGSDEGTAAFNTSLATLHAFQGWADKFLSTPTAGIVDTYVGVDTTFSKINLGLVYHTLASDFGDTDYGDEIDFVASTQIGPIGLTLKYADYSTDSFATDTSKIWIMAFVKF